MSDILHSSIFPPEIFTNHDLRLIESYTGSFIVELTIIMLLSKNRLYIGFFLFTVCYKFVVCLNNDL